VTATLLRENQSFVTTEVGRVRIPIGKLLGSGLQGEVYEGELEGERIAVKWYTPEWIALDPYLPNRLRDARRRDPPSPRFLWPFDVVVSDDTPGFGYVMPFRTEQFHEFAEMISGLVRASFRTLATAAIETAEAYQRLHLSGLCYVDISPRNIALDPQTGEVRICDCDNVDVNGRGMMSSVSGTEGFMAPEIVMQQAHPTRLTDLWSLAVLLFSVFVRNHPLEGRKEHDISFITKSDQARLWGPEALFIFDPDDSSNRPVEGYNDAALLCWSIYPEYIRRLFTRAFTEGIRDPQHGRVLETDWRSAMAQLRDEIVSCRACEAQNFHDGSAARLCWNCDQPISAPRLMTLGGAHVVLEDGAALYPHHVDSKRHPDSSAPVARVVRHEQRADLLGLENNSNAAWRVTLPHGEERTLEPGECAGIHPQVRIHFGKVEGRII
jgi:serine/threonine protein kinase